MLHPLLFLSAVIALAGAEDILNISSCPITFYGQKYEQIYVSLLKDTVALCFNGFYDQHKAGDCVLGLPAETYLPQLRIVNSDEAGGEFSQLESFMSAVAKCVVMLTTKYQSLDAVVQLANYGTQAAMRGYLTQLGVWELATLVGGAQVDKMVIHNNGTSKNENEALMDLSKCRVAGVLYDYSEMSYDPKTCTRHLCSKTASLQTFRCGPRERCQGDGSCIPSVTCTLTGPTVIDIKGKVNSVKDRCTYFLALADRLYITAKFQERRRKDVSFLDSVVLQKEFTIIQLEQGGRVLVDGSTLTLDNSPQLVDGVEISKGQTGITVNTSSVSSTVSVTFDGYTAQIHAEGAAAVDMFGMCSDSNQPLDELREYEDSSVDCGVQYNDTADSSIDCNSVTERCNLLKAAPFSSCKNDVNPEPFITACTDTLCKYPMVDGLNCQFLEVYARACSLQGNYALEGWQSQAGCSPQAFCQDRTCSAHEFCGEESAGGDTHCFCRAIFASKYKSSYTMGEPTVCSPTSASVSLANCLLEDKGIKYSDLHLNDQSCRGQMDENTHMVTFSFDTSNSCGMVATTHNDQIIYKNTITTQNSSSVITRYDQFSIDFSCMNTQPDIKTATFRIRESSLVQHITSGNWTYTVTMKAFTDASHTQAVESSTELQLNQKIWVQLDTDGLDGDAVAVVIESCWATDQASPTGSPSYDLISNGCANPSDQTVKVEGNGLGLSSTFSFNMFQFSGSSGVVYLHCKLHLCVKQKDSCVPNCEPVLRPVRSTHEGEAPAIVSMAWAN